MNVTNTKAVEPQTEEEVTSFAPEASSSVRARRLPEKAPNAFRTISEVADELGVQQHVLRFWETKFTQVKPLKRGGGRRYYRPEDVILIKKIHNLLYTEGYTIKGVQKLLKEQGRGRLLAEAQTEAVAAANAPEAEVAQALAVNAEVTLNSRQKAILQSMLGELKELRDMIKSGEE